MPLIFFRRICFNEAVVFLNMSTSLHKSVAAGTHLADGKFLNLTGNGEVSEITNISNIQQKGQLFKTE